MRLEERFHGRTIYFFKLREIDTQSQRCSGIGGCSGNDGSRTDDGDASLLAFHVPDLVMVDAITLADGIRSRQVSCVEVMTAYLDHIEQVQSKGERNRCLTRSCRLAGASKRARRATCTRRIDGSTARFSVRRKGFGTGQRYQDDIWLSNSERFCPDDGQHHGRTATQSRCNIHRQDQHA